MYFHSTLAMSTADTRTTLKRPQKEIALHIWDTQCFLCIQRTLTKTKTNKKKKQKATRGQTRPLLPFGILT